MMRALAAAVLLLAAGVSRAAQVELAYGEEVLTRGYAGWRAASLEAGWGGAGEAALTLSARALDRFALRDLEAGAAGSVPLGAGWRAGAEASASATHRVVPAWSAGLQLQRALGRGFVASAAARWSRYLAAATATDTGLGSLGVERYFGAQRLAWTGYLSTLAGTWSGSQRLAWDLFLREGDRLGVAIAAGRELESVGGGEVRGARVFAAALTGRHAVADGWSLSWELGVQRQGELYVRTGGRVGLRRDF
jgi:YaiO family outer membrane protein